MRAKKTQREPLMVQTPTLLSRVNKASKSNADGTHPTSTTAASIDTVKLTFPEHMPVTKCLVCGQLIDPCVTDKFFLVIKPKCGSDRLFSVCGKKCMTKYIHWDDWADRDTRSGDEIDT